MLRLNPVDMAEATRLTREGRLKDAVALLTGRQTSAPSSDKAPASTEVRERSRIGGSGVREASREPAPPHGTTASTLGDTLQAGLRSALTSFGGPGSAVRLDRRSPQPTAPVPNGARFDEHSVVSEAGTLLYKLFIPSRAGTEAMPLVVMLHGCTQSPDDFAAGTRMNDLAEVHGVLVAYPAQSRSANASKCWNWFRATDQQRGRGEPALIVAMVRQIMAEMPVDAERIYAAGLSAGGAAAAVLGQTYPELFAAVGVHSGLACGAATDMPSAFTAMKQGATAARVGRNVMPTIVFHGDRDATVSPVNGNQVIAQAEGAMALQASVDHGRAPGGMSFTRTIQTDRDGRPMLEHWVLHGGGHAWSGGSDSGSYTDPRGPDASEAMLNFFRHHRVRPS